MRVVKEEKNIRLSESYQFEYQGIEAQTLLTIEASNNSDKKTNLNQIGTSRPTEL